jgi:hypothetical protein
LRGKDETPSALLTLELRRARWNLDEPTGTWAASTQEKLIFVVVAIFFIHFFFFLRASWNRSAGNTHQAIFLEQQEFWGNAIQRTIGHAL